MPASWTPHYNCVGGWKDLHVMYFKFVNRKPSQCCLRISTIIKKDNDELILKKIVYYGEEKKSELTTIKIEPIKTQLLDLSLLGVKKKIQNNIFH